MTPIARRGLAVAAALTLLLIVASVVLAQTELLNGKLRFGDTVSVASGETVDGDLYVFAGNATVDGTINGDLVVFSGQAQLNGTVTGDVYSGAGTLTVGGNVTGDVRTGAGQATVTGSVGEDLVAAGGQVTLASSAKVGGDFIVSGGTVSSAGSVTGSIEGAAGTYDRTGSVGGSEHIRIQQREEPQQATGNAILGALAHYVVLLILGALILWLVPRVLWAADDTLRQQPLRSLGAGVATIIGWIVFWIVAILLMILLAIAFGILRLGALVAIDIIGTLLALGVVSFLLVLALAFLGDLVVGLGVARTVLSGGPGNRWRELGLLAAGAAVVVIATSLPIIGWLVKLVVMLVGVGALTLVAWAAWRRPSAPAAPPPAMPAEAAPTA